MKFATYAEYDPKATALCVPALLSVWAGLKRFSEELVVVGGLVPHFICRHPQNDAALPRPATIDVDIGIALGASAGQYGSMRTDLQAQGFKLSSVDASCFEKVVGIHTVYLDFLVEHPRARTGTVVVDDIPANVFPGIERALETARTTTISGKDLFGAEQSIQIRVCEVGPFLAMKLRSFAGRQTPKDAFDLLYTVRHYDGGTERAIAAFAVELENRNPAMADAIACLGTHFANEESSAPVRAAHFVHGPVDTSDSGDVSEARQQIQQDMVTLGVALRAALPGAK